MWQSKTFTELTTSELYAIYNLRVKTFVVEQQRIYQEVDEIDITAIHIFKMHNGKIIAYARVFQEDDHLSFGRVVVDASQRGQHLGAALMTQILAVAKDRFPVEPIQIEAQIQVQAFYERYNFQVVGQPFIFNQTPHLKMIRDANLT
ncbi:GNAT family N-acetyltransferase [Lactobacillus sp.] [Lactiplantibacillus mudanjiangensis]|uniref:GNAT family N-acetyltransferase n=1 Tax=Lactiplantibacillus mudanjiangensis TaxID=1296538 RepID=UPI0010150027|nr:GNAT family N-acetyltransferase [Lactobacillus sp.] [Lactiplantibacillus mudanjiangensis]